MFSRKSRATAASAIPSHPDDNLRLKSTGERVTILGRTPDGAVKVALVDKPYPCEDIVSADDIRPA
ncbi:MULTISPECIES: hypothetical protein [unclassified Streptomyces]|uniref:hypothetical protein n=1 Tax=unclassified Streptomyces TaxID=2593676 RepID=UPI0022712048|nr:MULTISPECIES: hypothetical protein [unclassified Streptomyces]MCY0917018.1 hypothetical protein [Streptomyces sp. H27-G5]MCY0959958.1 hypothetical protein [Streptomyces sp. H27-H5]